MGELTANYLDNNTNLSNQQIIETSKLTGALTSAAIAGPDDGNSVFAGSQIARNAAQNNYLMPNEKKELVEALKSCAGSKICEQQVQNKYEKISEPRDEEFDMLYDACKIGDQSACSSFKQIHYDLRMKLTEEGNEYYLTHKDEFKLLPPGDSVFHTFQRDPQTRNVINVLTGREQGVTKYVHPIYGYEVVLDINKNIINDPMNAGTYNFYNPSLGQNNPLLEGFINHKDYDIDPYYRYGNASYPIDPTTYKQRLLRSTNRLF